MKFSDLLSRPSLKFVLLIYVFISIVYTGARFYNLTDASLAKTARRSVIEFTEIESSDKDTFFVAPIAQEAIEKDEEDELRRNLYRDYQLALAESKGKTIQKLCNVFPNNLSYIFSW